MILGMPWWVFMIILFIFFSGYMAFRAMRAERELEQHFIERDGQVYMKRIEDERESRRLKQEETAN
ncbi:sporulation YhaL family protein [Ornithinibacillus californiensis]|uniref:sporulation YhaL family protein n=1 Tax=Ornithinibacillus californiensis TaxID=161536 RepID=UPI0009FC56A8|nr:sporulation YhaL family protein [Ornithinibacillus californiensis]